MKNQNRCPGCSKHCCLDQPKCKYGRNYSRKIHLDPQKKSKWEKYVHRDNSFGMLIRTGKKLKKCLIKKQISEAQLLNVLNGQERESLAGLLEKINFALTEAKNK